MIRSRRGSRQVIILLVTSLASAALVMPAVVAGAVLPANGCPTGSPIVVTTTADENNVANGLCSLREAVNAANADATPDTISVPAGVYELSLDNDLDITTPITVTGAGQSLTVVDGSTDGTIDDRVFDVSSSASLILGDLTVRNGFSSIGGGGGIRNANGALALSRVTVTANGSNEDGGGIASSGTLALADVTVSGNRTTADGDNGGGVYIEPQSFGAADVATLNGVTITGNSAGDTSGDDAHGGGLYAAGGIVTVTDSTIDGNRAWGNGDGGGVYVSAGTVTITRSTVSANDADDDGGGIYFRGAATLTNVTVSGNTAVGDGGGLRVENAAASVSVTNVTVTANTAGASGDGIQDDAGTISTRNSIVAGNSGTDCGGDDPLDGADSVPNLESGTSCGFTIQGADPGLGPLAANAPGATETHAILGSGSSAVDAGTSASAPAVDQRGVLRPQGPQHDLGAYELEATDLTLTVTATDQVKAYGDPTPTLTFTYTGFAGSDAPDDVDTPPTCTTDATQFSSVAGSPYTITCAGAADDVYTFDYVDGELSVIPADARVRYIGETHFVASGRSSTVAQVTLTASLQAVDEDDVLTSATVSFVDLGTGAVLSADVPVQPVAGQPHTGTASVRTTLGTGRHGSTSYLIGVVATGNYSNARQPVADTTATVVVMKPTTMASVDGDGTITPTAPAGNHAGDPTADVAFHIEMGPNAGSANSKGKITLAVPQADGSVVVVRSTAISSMDVAGAGDRLATIYAKATLSVVNGDAVTSLEGNAVLRVDVIDHAAGGDPDEVGFTVLSSQDGSLLYSNRWVLANDVWGTNTQTLDVGSVAIS